jgi:hypothetical protein
MTKIHNKKGLISIEEYVKDRMKNDDIKDIIEVCTNFLEEWYKEFEDEELKELGLKRKSNHKRTKGINDLY